MNFPNESSEYRQARDEPLQAEMELRRHEKQVASQRRALPVGGEVTGDYISTRHRKAPPAGPAHAGSRAGSAHRLNRAAIAAFAQ
jgi:uncharacterized protein DUF899